MLYSPAHRLAFAHYPKTAGSAISVWFRRAFPDAVEAVPGEPHVGVRRALAALGGTWPVIGGLRMAHGHGGGSAAREVRIIGVVRSPFEMLVSLYEYWRRLEPHPGPGNRLIDTARTGTFRQFLQRAISGRRLPATNHSSTWAARHGPARGSSISTPLRQVSSVCSTSSACNPRCISNTATGHRGGGGRWPTTRPKRGRSCSRCTGGSSGITATSRHSCGPAAEPIAGGGRPDGPWTEPSTPLVLSAVGAACGGTTVALPQPDPTPYRPPP